MGLYAADMTGCVCLLSKGQRHSFLAAIGPDKMWLLFLGSLQMS